jgi:hypothetical protein
MTKRGNNIGKVIRMKRYTIKELNEFSDYEMLYSIVKDRQESVTNPYSPLNERLEKLMTKLINKIELTR